MRQISKTAPILLRLRRLIVAPLLLCGMAATASSACSVPPSYRVPTEFELVQRADLIVVALVVSGPELAIPNGGESDYVVHIAPMQVLKGVLPARPIALEGMVGVDGIAFESAPPPPAAAHDLLPDGGCTRRYYAKGKLVLAMYERTPAGMRPVAAPLARTVEDVESFDSPRVRTARRYVAMQEGAAGGDLRPVVIAERDRLRALGSDGDAQAVAADLQAWLDARAGSR
jgi:hypothetical protein